MKSKNPKIQILMKGITISLITMFTITPVVFAASNLDDSYLKGSIINKVLYGTVGSTVKEIEEYFSTEGNITLYIYNETQLRAFAEYVNSGHTCEGKEIKLLNNIIVNSNEEWVPIGNSDNRFKGTFDGQGYTISGVNLNRGDKLDSELTNVGLFGYVENAVIKNITLANSKIDIPYNVSSDILYKSEDIIDGLDYIARFQNAGGIAGINDKGIIENCKINSDVTISGLSCVGGIVGHNYAGTIINCTNNGDVEGLSEVGGIAGKNNGLDTSIKVSNTVDFSKDSVGKIINCVNEKDGDIYSLIGAAGGISGSLRKNAIIQKSTNNGDVKVSTEIIRINVSGRILPYEPQNIGGIAGYVSGELNDAGTLRCYVAIDGCINYKDAKIVGYKDIGGIAGQLAGASGGYAILSNSINYSLNVEATKANSDAGEAGYLAGDMGAYGADRDNKDEDSVAILYNDLYFMTDGKEGAAFAKEADDKTILDVKTLGYGNINDSRQLYKKYVTTFVKDAYSNNSIYMVTDDAEELVKMKEYDFSKTDLGLKEFYPIHIDSNSKSETKVELIKDNTGTLNVNVDKEYIYAYDKNIDGFNINSNNEYTIDNTTGTTVKYSIYKGNSLTNGKTYFKTGDTLKIKAEFNKYLAETYGPLAKISEAPTLKLNNSIEMKAGSINATQSNYTTSIEYTYTVKEGDNIEVKNLNLTLNGTVYAINGSDYETNHQKIMSKAITTEVSGIYFDTIAPTINTKVYVEDALETGRYTKGKEILINITTSEAIDGDFVAPKVQVSFSKSGIGKYNYTKEPETVGYAKCEDSRRNVDGTVTWKYSYIIQEGDEGDLQLKYAEGQIKDLAGNITVLTDLNLPDSSTGDVDISTGINSNFANTKVEYEIYINDNKITEFSNNTYLTEKDTVKIVANIDKVLYQQYGYYNGEEKNQPIDNKTAPNLYLNDIKQTNKSVKFYKEDVNNATTSITYTFNNLKKDDLTKITSLNLKNDSNNENSIFASKIYETTYKEENKKEYSNISNNAIVKKDITNCNLFIDSVGKSELIKNDGIYADTTSPTVDIAVKSGEENIDSLTNKNTFIYTFTFSEEVTEFTKEDVKVTNGTIKELVQAKDKKVYTATIDTTIADGNVGDMEVVVEQDACKDLVGYGNIRNSKVITIDRRAALLVSLEARAESNITVNQDIDNVKEYYKVGDTVTIVATFNENIENTKELPVLVLQFSESGTAKQPVSAGTVNGNKITYKYTIAEGDKGSLSVKGFSGTVVDSAGNETIVTKRALDGDTIIADSEVPAIVGVKVVAPDFKYDELLSNKDETKRYGVGNKISFFVEYSENIYNLDGNQINNITKETAPVLEFKFGNSVKTAEYESTNGKIMEYSYTITAENGGDNGDLSSVVIKGIVSDIAGNTVTNPKLSEIEKYEESIKEENKVDKITADTTKPTFTVDAKAVNKADNGDTITGNDKYYRKGSIVTITATSNEYVYNKENESLNNFKIVPPSLTVKFGENTAKGTIKYKDVVYEANKTKFTYEYTIQKDDNGAMSISIADGETYDIALNGNNKYNETKEIEADTINPTYRDNNGDIVYKNGAYTVTFNEKLYYLENNVVKTFGNIEKAPVLKFEGLDTFYKPSINGNVITYKGTEVNSKPYLSNSSLCDRAGNLYAYYDQEAPELSSIKVIKPEDKTGTYSSGTEVELLATFNEKIKGTAPTLQIVFGDGEIRTLNNGKISENTITYTYTIQEGDNGELKIKAFEGTGLTDLSGNKWTTKETPSIKEGTITADTIKPTVTIKAYTNYKNNSKKVEISGKTNTELTTYEFTWSENVKEFTTEDINVTNGTKGEFTKINDKVYILDVITSNEGKQTISILPGVCTDTAKEIGNPNEGARCSIIEIDNTLPIIRFITPNGGNYTTSTKDGKAQLKARIEISEKVETFKYRVVKIGEKAPEYAVLSKDDINSSDIDITISNATEGNYVVEVIAIDEAGNEAQAKSNKYIVTKNEINIKLNTEKPTNQDVIATITYGDVLTENKKAGVSGISQSADSSKVIVTENGTVYAEATDLAGNKVYATKEVTNIDKTAPEATIKYTENEDKSVTATITFNEPATITNNEGKNTYTFTENGEFTFEFKDAVGNKATATAKVTTIVKEQEVPPVEEDKTAPEITFNYLTIMDVVGAKIGATITTNEDAVISYKWNNGNWTPSNGYVRNLKAVTTPGKAGEYTLYAKAIDKSGNTSKVSELKFTVVNSEEDIRKPEVIFEDLTTIQKNGVKYVKVSPKFTIDELNAKMDKDALLGRTVEYKKLTDDNKFKTGSEITIDGDIKYIIIVNGDVNCDGKVDFLGDIVMINSFRIGATKDLKDIQILAGDINNSGEIDFIPDIVAMNDYRLGRIEVL